MFLVASFPSNTVGNSPVWAADMPVPFHSTSSASIVVEWQRMRDAGNTSGWNERTTRAVRHDCFLFGATTHLPASLAPPMPPMPPTLPPKSTRSSSELTLTLCCKRWVLRLNECSLNVWVIGGDVGWWRGGLKRGWKVRCGVVGCLWGLLEMEEQTTTSKILMLLAEVASRRWLAFIVCQRSEMAPAEDLCMYLCSMCVCVWEIMKAFVCEFE